MLITNDVALITFVPLTLLTLTRAGKPRLLIPVITLQTVAANLGSMFTPLGNPQNLYLYSYYHLSAGRFLGIMLPPTALSLAGLCACLLLIRPEPLATVQAERPRAVEPARALPWAGLFIACIALKMPLVHREEIELAALAGGEVRVTAQVVRFRAADKVHGNAAAAEIKLVLAGLHQQTAAPLV